MLGIVEFCCESAGYFLIPVMFWLIASEEFAEPSQVIHLPPLPLANCRHLAGSVEEFQIAAVTRLLAEKLKNYICKP